MVELSAPGNSEVFTPIHWWSHGGFLIQVSEKFWGVQFPNTLPHPNLNNEKSTGPSHGCLGVKNIGDEIWLVVSTHLKNINQIGSFPQVEVKIKNVWNHQLEIL